MAEKLNHPGGRLQVIPHLVKSLQSNLGYLESHRQTHAFCLPKQPPALSSAEQVKVGKNVRVDPEAVFQISEKEEALILVCESWP